MLTIKDKQFSDDEVYAAYQKRKKEYAEWCHQKAAEYLQNKKRKKYYQCNVIVPEDVEDEWYMPLNDEIVARLYKLKEEIANDPTLKTDTDRADEFHDRLDEVAQDIKYDYPGSVIFTNIDLDDYRYYYKFDTHLLDWKKNENGITSNTSAYLKDEEYITLLAFLIAHPKSSFQNLAFQEPEIKTIYDKVSEELHNHDFGVFHPFCHEHDYAIRMTELRADANALLKQMKKNKEEYPYIGFLNDFLVNFIVKAKYNKKL